MVPGSGLQGLSAVSAQAAPTGQGPEGRAEDAGAQVRGRNSHRGLLGGEPRWEGVGSKAELELKKKFSEEKIQDIGDIKCFKAIRGKFAFSLTNTDSLPADTLMT